MSVFASTGTSTERTGINFDPFSGPFGSTAKPNITPSSTIYSAGQTAVALNSSGAADAAATTLAKEITTTVHTAVEANKGKSSEEAAAADKVTATQIAAKVDSVVKVNDGGTASILAKFNASPNVKSTDQQNGTGNSGGGFGDFLKAALNAIFPGAGGIINGVLKIFGS